MTTYDVPDEIVAAVNGPAVGLGCSLVALSDVVYMAESAHLADPHVAIALTAEDRSFQSAELRATLDRALAPKDGGAPAS